MNLMHPILLLGALGIALPILAHLLNKHQFKQTQWAAMQFLTKAVNVRSRQIRPRDIILLLLRCLAVLLLVFAFTKPVMNQATGFASRFGQRRAGIIIALDASFSMRHSDGNATRFERAVEKIQTIAADIHRGDPVCLVLLGAEHRVVARNMAFDPDRFETILQNLKATPETLDLDSVPRHLKELVDGMQAPQKEIYIVTDMQQQDWKNRSEWLCDAFEDLDRISSLCIVPVRGTADNLAITSLELVSGVLRKGTVARYRATVRNFGDGPAANVRVKGMVNNINVDTKIIPNISAGRSETVSLFVPFQDSGEFRITAELDRDSLTIDNRRRAVAIVRERVSVLCVEGSPLGVNKSAGFITAALRARSNGGGQEDFTVQTVPWVGLPGQDLDSFDVVVLADVPDITADQARRFEEYVRKGNGLIWFAGDNMKGGQWNRRSVIGETPLLPALIEKTLDTSDAMGVGGALDPIMPDHLVCRPLLSLPEDLLSEARFLKILQVKPSATSFTVLSLAGSGLPVLIEQSVGRGHVFMFTTSADPAWNNMAMTPVFPMMLQQMVTYLTAREFEKPRMVGDSLSLSYVDQPDSSDAVFDTPSKETITVGVRRHRNQYVALVDHADQAGFYQARVSVQAPGMPIAVNVNTVESNVKCMPVPEMLRSFEGTGIMVADSQEQLLDAVEQMRTRRSFWFFFMIVSLTVLIIESLVADRLFKNSSASKKTPSFARTEDI